MSASPAAHTPNPSGQWHSLSEHLSDVATGAGTLAAKFGARELGYYAGLWHDLGKYHPAFQHYLQQCHAGHTASSVRHAEHGARLAWEQCQWLAPVIYGHHAGLPEFNQMKQQLHEPQLQSRYREVLLEARKEWPVLEPPTDPFQLCSNQPVDKCGQELLLRMIFSALVDADYLDTEEHFNPGRASERRVSASIGELWNLLEGQQELLLSKCGASPTLLNQARAEIYRTCCSQASLAPGVFRLSVPTGGGKTRSGLAFALLHALKHQRERVVLAIPYTSIIEQTVSVYRSLFGNSAVLEDHSAARADFGSGEDAHRLQAQARLASENWNAPLVVTTTVQLFESLLACRPGRCRKLHNLVNSVIILDEVQTLPLALLTPILGVLRELVRGYGVSVVLCTATQPELEGENLYLQGFESGTVRNILTDEQERRFFASLSRVKYEYQAAGWSWVDLWADIEAHRYSQALIVLNTRKDALQVLKTLDDRAGSEYGIAETHRENVQQTLRTSRLLHLSTLLCGAHRQEVLTEVKRRLDEGDPCLLVSTQVVEAGVNLDFPVVYRALGPLDRIVQAAGRCNREGNLSEGGRVVIFDPTEGSTPKGEYATACVESKRILQRTGVDLNDPAVFKEYFSRLYQDVETDKHGIQDLRRSLSYRQVAEKFKLINEDTAPVFVLYEMQAQNLARQIHIRGLLASDYRALQPYLVSLRRRDLDQQQALLEEIAPGLMVWRGTYHPLWGIGLGDRVLVDPADLVP